MLFRSLCAADYGVPQKRERVIVVGIRNDIYAEKGDFVFPEKGTGCRLYEGSWKGLPACFFRKRKRTQGKIFHEAFWKLCGNTAAVMGEYVPPSVVVERIVQ